MINHAHIQDIRITEDFGRDYENVPKQIQRKMKSLIEMILDHGSLPNSMQAHKAVHNEIWIGYVTRSGQHWRVLFSHDEEENTVIMHRLLTHDKMDMYI